ncbi:MAG: fused MFS/spermidine synthase, partial [Gemmatimonadaceae bacterium]
MNSPPPSARSGVRSARSARYAVAIFLSSSLLFLLEPIAAKRLLPLLGGSAAVWTACLVFFQCALLLGYATAHWIAGIRDGRTQATTYVALLAASLLQLWLAVSAHPTADPARPISSVLWLLAILIGVPFVTLSATSPLLQAWFARAVSAGESATPAQPYRLFAISNVGSLISLLVYPWLIEPRFTLHGQMVALGGWFTILAIVCGAIAWSIAGLPAAALAANAAPAESIGSSVSEESRPWAWIALAACGSLLLSAVTIHLSQNVATIPLLWII